MVGVTVARPGCRVTARRGARDVLPRVRTGWRVSISAHRRVARSGLPGSSHAAIHRSRACHTTAPPGRKPLSAPSDHRGRGLVSGDVLVGARPMLATPNTRICRIDSQNRQARSGRHSCKPHFKYRSRNARKYGFTERLTAGAATQALSADVPHIGEVKILDNNYRDLQPQSESDYTADGMAYLGVAAAG